MEINYDEISNSISSDNLNTIGMGSGRMVYDLGDGYVVKKARNKRGIAQNKVEHKISANNNSKLIAEVISVSDDYIYLIMKKADKISSSREIWNYYNVKNFNELFSLDSFYELIKNNDLLLPDLYRKSSWGIIDGRPVLIDYGFTKEVRRRYYRLF